MKTNSTQVLILRIILFILICLYSFLVFGQPIEIFQGKTQESSSKLPAEEANLPDKVDLSTDKKARSLFQ